MENGRKENNMSKLYIKEQIPTSPGYNGIPCVDIDFFADKELDSLQKDIKLIKNKVKSMGYINAYFETEHDSYDLGISIYLYGDRYETDEEERKRLLINKNATLRRRKNTKQAKLKQLKKEKEVYLKLKKKFEGEK